MHSYKNVDILDKFIPEVRKKVFSYPFLFLYNDNSPEHKQSFSDNPFQRLYLKRWV